MGWFDQKENSPGVLSACMASDTSVINGVSAEGLATSLEAFFSLCVGISLGFYFSWRESLIGLICAPFIIIGGIMNMKL